MTDDLPPLKIALIGAIDEQWKQRLITRLLAEPNMKIVGRVNSEAFQTDRKKTGSLFTALLGIEARLVARPIVAGLGGDLKNIDETDSVDAEALRALNLDVVIDLTSEHPFAELARATNANIWWIDIAGPGGLLSAFRAAARDVPVAEFKLMQYAGDIHGEEVIATGALNSKVFASRNLLLMKEKAPILIMRELRRLRDTRKVGKIPIETGPQDEKIDLIEFTKYVSRIVAGIAARGWEKVSADILGTRPGLFYLKTGQGSVLDFDPVKATAIMPEGNHYWADPYLIERDGETFCFFEDYDYAAKQGHICVGRLRGDSLVEVRTALKTEYHLSYPFLFHHEGDLFMVPETHQTQRLEIWRCKQFPDQWELHKTVLDGCLAADTSIAEINGEWWLFSNISSDVSGEQNSELHVYRIDGPEFKNLTPHALNPVVLDARTARNAGRIHVKDGRVFRPSQDNAFGLYGYGLNIMEITELSLERYVETRVRHITPDFEPGIIGCHHYDEVGGRFIIDVRKRKGGRAKD